MEEAHKKQLDTIRREAASTAEAINADYIKKEAELQRQLEYVRKTAEAETARIQRRSEAEMADLRATISRLEVDIMKVSSILQLVGLLQYELTTYRRTKLRAKNSMLPKKILLLGFRPSSQRHRWLQSGMGNLRSNCHKKTKS